MDRHERTLILHRILKTARYPVSLKRVQEELQCSRATMYRDIAFLRDALGAPIESDPESGAIHYASDEAERFELPGLWLSSDEMAALLALNELLDRSDPGVLAGALAPFQFHRVQRDQRVASFDRFANLGVHLADRARHIHHDIICLHQTDIARSTDSTDHIGC